MLIIDHVTTVWHYWSLNFKTRDTKLERFLQKNQHTQRNLLNFENWTNANGEPHNLQKSEFLKLIFLTFHSKKLKDWCELDVGVIPCNF